MVAVQGATVRRSSGLLGRFEGLLRSASSNSKRVALDEELPYNLDDSVPRK